MKIWHRITSPPSPASTSPHTFRAATCAPLTLSSVPPTSSPALLQGSWLASRSRPGFWRFLFLSSGGRRFWFCFGCSSWWSPATPWDRSSGSVCSCIFRTFPPSSSAACSCPRSPARRWRRSSCGSWSWRRPRSSRSHRLSSAPD